MALYECVWVETNRISLNVHAHTPEEAVEIAKAAVEENGWEACQEDTEGTDGVEEVYDEENHHELVWGGAVRLKLSLEQAAYLLRHLRGTKDLVLRDIEAALDRVITDATG